jgi:arginyl-tRNA--protein-N-Asp/Glu arginylyltransferase
LRTAVVNSKPVGRVALKTPPSPCQYLPDQQCQLQQELWAELHPADYMGLVKDGWRRAGPVVYRPDCPDCRRCQSLRVPVDTFLPTESQRRAWRRNAADVEVRIGLPSNTPQCLELFGRFHSHGHRTKGWPAPDEGDMVIDLLLMNPFRTEEWSYWIDGRLAGLGYVDALPEGLSAIYFIHDPDHHRRSLGTFNILMMIDAARRRNLPHVYLGYYVKGCRSLEYKARFSPNQILRGMDWEPFTSSPSPNRNGRQVPA